MPRRKNCHGRRLHAWCILGLMIIMALAQGCATPAARDADQVAEICWWHVRYRIAWPEDTPPDWRVDLLLADAVIRPVLDAYRGQIRYWRIHRRALEDDAGHQFSFLFYADRDTAAGIYKALQEDRLTGQLLENQVLEKMLTDDLNNNHLHQMQDTSDKSWPVILQIAWPAYIMGVSDLWLQLIDQLLVRDTMATDTNNLLRQYGNVNVRITTIWQYEGPHALLHHLNAIFGYEPLKLDEQDVQF